ncbi:MAG: glycosyltransferase family 4 protein, partial [Bryobacteraceae bacterium]
MRLALFSPLPPARSGIADYTSALLGPLEKLANVTVFSSIDGGAGSPEARRFRADDFDIALYQIGNNSWHAHAYQHALRYPGVVVMHESNLHHLIADITIKRGDWNAYLREVEYDGGPEALAHAERVRTLQIGPDYDGVRMMRRILEVSRGVIVHSRSVETEVRAAGFTGPVAVIPHGAWVPDADRMGSRERLGVSPAEVLIGVFGFLKPYKRIAQSLRVFRRLLRVQPHAKMILVGEPHPEFPIQALIQRLGISASVRILGYTPIEDFVDYMAACDIVLNLRFPTVGESSGTLLRSLGLGKAVIVSDVGSFSEYPDEICLKAPVDETEEDCLFEYLSLLASRPDLRIALGERARSWVAEECSWDLVANRYFHFLQAVQEGRRWEQPVKAASEPAKEAAAAVPAVPEEYILGWVPQDRDARKYARTHITRLARTLEITPRGGPEDRVLEMGAYLQITPALKTRLGYGEVRGCYYGPPGSVQRRTVISEEGEVFECEVDLFDAEKDEFPYADGHFSTVLCCELLEH